MRRLFLAGLAATLLATIARADDPPQCALNSGGTSNPPSGKVFITINSIKLNSDMEPDVWPFDNKADVYGTIEINADGAWETFSLPEIGGNDYPHWTENNRFVSRPAAPEAPVRFVVRLRESDLATDDDIVDTSPDPTRDDLEFTLDTCSLILAGDLTGSSSALVPFSAGAGSNQGLLSIKVGMDDGRPISPATGDVAIAGFDLIQVLPDRGRLVGNKPTVGMVTVANNTIAPQPVSVRLRITNTGGTVLHDSTESIGTLAVGEVASKYLATASPIVFPTSAAGGSCGYDILATAMLILQPGAEQPPPSTSGRCTIINNSSGARTFRVIPTKAPTLVWLRTGRLLDAGHLATHADMMDLHDKAMPFIRGVYPFHNPTDLVAPFSFIPPASSAWGFLAALLTGLGIPADALEPFALTFELHGVAALIGVDRIMGVVPKDWFENFLYDSWGGTTGVSLGEVAPRAVLFQVSGTQGTTVGNDLVLPGHELGHTYALSRDPTIKNWTCSVVGDVGTILCGMGGGFDEYNSDDHPNGVPTWGYWVPQGPMTGGTAAITGQQCNSNCLMGSGTFMAETNWVPGNQRLIDSADFDHTFDKLNACTMGKPIPDWIYLSGLIHESDAAHFGWTFTKPDEARVVDFAERPGEIATPYGFVFRGARDELLGEAELPVGWADDDIQSPLPIMFFGGYARLPAGARRVEVWNRLNGKLLAKKEISANRPVLGTPAAKVSTDASGNKVLEVRWSASDADRDPLTHFVHLDLGRGRFVPLAHGLAAPTFSLQLNPELRPGTYVVRALTSDGVNVESRDVTFSF